MTFKTCVQNSLLNRISFSTFAKLSLIFVSSCGTHAANPTFGIRTIQVKMIAEHVSELMHGASEPIDESGTATYSTNAGVTYTVEMEGAGASTVRESKKSFDLKFKSSSDGSKGEPVNHAKQTRLATTIMDKSMIRAILSLQIAKAAGLPTSTIEPVFVYLNDLRLGLYMMIEKVNGSFFKHHKIKYLHSYEAKNGADFEPDMVLRLNKAFKVKPEPGNAEAMRVVVEALSISDDAQFETRVFQLLDRTTIVNYMAYALLANHFDGFSKNLFYYVPKKGSSAMRLVPWDFDLDWSSDHTTLKPWAGNKLFERFAALPDVMSDVQTEAQTLATGDASLSSLQNTIATMTETMRDAYAADPALGGAGLSIDTEAAKLSAQIQAWYAQNGF